jgi:hypothetical protein
MAEGAVDQAKDAATETVTLNRGELWLLRIAAATGIASLLSHGADLVTHVL